MKANLGLVLIVAVASSLVTAGVLELLRAEPRLAAARPAPESSTTATAKPQALSLRPAQPLELDLDGRLRTVERRLDQLELAARSVGSTRAPVTAREDEPADRAELRELVLDWVAEEREARRREAEQEEEEARLEEREFEIRVEARKMAAEHGLADWEEENLVAVWIEVETKREEMHAGFDRLTSDPADVERQLTEFEEWVKLRAIEAIGPQRANQLFGF